MLGLSVGRFDKSRFRGLSCAYFGGFYQYFSHLFTRNAWFCVHFPILLYDEEHACFTLNLPYFNSLLLSFDAVISVLSNFRNYRLGMTQKRGRKHVQKGRNMKYWSLGSSSIGAPTHSTRSRGWNWLEAARKDGRIRADWKISIDAHAQLARTRGSQK